MLESSARLECQKLQQKIASLSVSQDLLQVHLCASRERELSYEIRLGIEQSKQFNSNNINSSSHDISNNNSNNNSNNSSSSHNDSNNSHQNKNDIIDDQIRNNSNENSNEHSLTSSEIDSTLDPTQLSKNKNNSSNNSNSSSNGKIIDKPQEENNKPDKIDIIQIDNTKNSENNELHEKNKKILENSLLSLQQAQDRGKEMQIELDEARTSLNDLILEIESVSVEEGRSREQSARVLRQMADR